MAVVRYIVLAALVVWLCGAINRLGGNMLGGYMLGGDLYRRLDWVAYACGATMLTGLLVMKFVGPPPRGFFARILIVVVMVILAAFGGVRGEPPVLVIIELVLGLILLSWYAHE